MHFEDSTVGNVFVTKVLDTRIASDVAPRLKAHLADCMSNGNRSIVLDLASVTFIDSSGLGALVSSLKSMGQNGDLVVAGVRGPVASMFKLTRMDRVFRMFENADAAVSSLSSGD